METKKAIRREIAARRKAAEESFLREASQKIAETVVARPWNFRRLPVFILT